MPLPVVDRRTFLAASTSALVGFSWRPALGQSQDPTGLTLTKASELVRTKAVSSVELTSACLKRIEEYNSILNAFITVTAEQALTAARDMDMELRRRNWRGPLHGIPIAVKDNMDTAGIRTTCLLYTSPSP